MDAKILWPAFAAGLENFWSPENFKERAEDSILVEVCILRRQWLRQHLRMQGIYLKSGCGARPGWGGGGSLSRQESGVGTGKAASVPLTRRGLWRMLTRSPPSPGLTAAGPEGLLDRVGPWKHLPRMKRLGQDLCLWSANAFSHPAVSPGLDHRARNEILSIKVSGASRTHEVPHYSER